MGSYKGISNLHDHRVLCGRSLCAPVRARALRAGEAGQATPLPCSQPGLPCRSCRLASLAGWALRQQRWDCGPVHTWKSTFASYLEVSMPCTQQTVGR